MKKTITALSLLLLFAAAAASAQTQIQTSIDQSKAQNVMRIAIPFPALPAGTDPQMMNSLFFAPLTRDISESGVFAIAPLPPNVPVSPDLMKRVNAAYLLDLRFSTTSATVEGNPETEYLIDVRLVDSGGGAVSTPKRYRAVKDALTKAAHMIAADLVRSVNGKPGIFTSQIAFASSRSGAWEIWLMDWDGGNQRRITYHNAMSILPSLSPDGERMVYTVFSRNASEMYIINRRGGGRIKIHTGLNLNTSARFSPVTTDKGTDIAFVGSVNGNPDIYVIRDDGTNLRRLTTASSIESTPEWSPNGRQICFTSGRSGTPQIYIMDAEGTNVRRISFEGQWNDDGRWAPDGERLAYTSRVNGHFQIRITNVVTGESHIVAGEGSNEQPTWSPDGQWIAFQSNRSGKWQVYRMRADGTDLMPLTSVGENKEPDWSKKAE